MTTETSKDTPDDSGMRPNAMPGRPDRYVNLKRAYAQAVEQEMVYRAKVREDERRAAAEELRKVPWLDGFPRVNFGDVLCPSCKATGGNRADGPCGRCGGRGVL